jgi:hypothetical protein
VTHVRPGSAAIVPLLAAFSCCEIVSAGSVSISGACTAADTFVLTPQSPTVTANLVCQQTNPPSPDHLLTQVQGSTQMSIAAESWLTFQNVTPSAIIVGSYAGVDFSPGPLPDGSVFPYRLNPYGGPNVSPVVLAPGQSYTITFPPDSRTFVNAFGYYSVANIASPAPFIGAGTYIIPIQIFIASNVAFFSSGPDQFAIGQLRIVDYRLALNLGPWPGGNDWLRYSFEFESEIPEPASIGMTALGVALMLSLNLRALRRLPAGQK